MTFGLFRLYTVAQSVLVSHLTPAASSSTTSVEATTANMTESKSEEVAARLARKNILELLPYESTRYEYKDGVLLDANENAFGPTSVPTKCIEPYDNSNSLERYPDPSQTELKELYAAYRGHGLTPANIFVGVGSDEAIDLLMRIFCRPGYDNIMITPPTYGMYNVCAKVNDVQILAVPLTPDFDVQIPETIAGTNENSKLMFICSPGNPTSKAISLSVIEELASSKDYQGIIVVDEAYIDFTTGEDGKPVSAVSLVNKYPNVVVLQTLSKAFGLAGIRCGFCIGSPDVIQLMNNVKAPYNVNSLTSEVATNAMASIPTLEKNVKSVLEQREFVHRQLESLDDIVVKVYPSDSNFLLFRVKNHAQKIYKTMADKGVVTRYRGSEMHCEECIRASIGTPEENQKFLALFQETWAALNNK